MDTTFIAVRHFTVEVGCSCIFAYHSPFWLFTLFMQIDIFHWIVSVMYIICVKLLLSGHSIIIVIACRQSQSVFVKLATSLQLFYIESVSLWFVHSLWQCGVEWP